MSTMVQPTIVEVFTRDVIRVPGSAAADRKRQDKQQRREAIRAYNRENFGRQDGSFNVTAQRCDVLGRVVEPPKAASRPVAHRQPAKPLAPKVRQLSKPAASRSSYDDSMYASDCGALLQLLRLV